MATSNSGYIFHHIYELGHPILGPQQWQLHPAMTIFQTDRPLLPPLRHYSVGEVRKTDANVSCALEKLSRGVRPGLGWAILMV